MVVLNRSTRYLLASIQTVIGWEWLMSGGNKLLSGIFPQSLADTLTSGFKDNPNGWYITFLQRFVLPNSVSFGYFIEWAELLVGLVLLGGAIILLGKPRMSGEPQHRLAVSYSIAVILASAIGAFLTVNFHFWAGHWIFPVFDPMAAGGEAVDLDALLPPLSLIVIVANVVMINELTRGLLFSNSSRVSSAVSTVSES